MPETPRRLPNGNFMVPVRVEYEGIIGDEYAEITPDHELYEQWAEWFDRREEANTT